MFVLDLLNAIFLLYSIPTFIGFVWNFYVNGKVLSDKGKSISIIICLLSFILLFISFCTIVYNEGVIKETKNCHYYMSSIQKAMLSYEKLPLKKKKDSDNNYRRQNSSYNKNNRRFDIIKEDSEETNSDEKEQHLLKRKIQVFTPDLVNDYLNLVKELEKNKLLDNKKLNKNKKCLYGVEYINEKIDIYCNNHGSLNKESKKYFYSEKKRIIEKFRNIKNIVLLLFTICIVVFVLNGSKFTGGEYKSFVMYADGKSGLNGKESKGYKKRSEICSDFVKAIINDKDE